MKSPTEEQMAAQIEEGAYATEQKKRRKSCVFILLKSIKPKKTKTTMGNYDDDYLLWKFCWRGWGHCQKFSQFTKPLVKRTFKFVEFTALLSAIVTVWFIYKQLSEMQQTRINDERAWVFANNSVDQMVAEKGDIGVFTISDKNYGKTPALNVQSVIGIGTSIYEMQDAMQKSGRVPPTKLNGVLLAPGESQVLHTPPVPTQIMANVSRGIPVFFSGTIWYDDIFGNHHWSRFCFKVEKSTMNERGVNYVPISVQDACDDAESK